ncbi:hypothetical protein COF54_11400 [Bacillus toyonensis]|uniref:hypothetical protein n=1 Tax=Bacillus toyonensis TaxID=155322 RepID=UPI000BFB3D67|nr:hypothetical protein [Bacillus toyonensis]PHD08595.1 hypothetical protein COF54_11400 [Bacillus toyonensis]
MRGKYLYLIEYNSIKFVVSAKGAVEAIDLWIQEKNRENKEDYNLTKEFRPADFSITELVREDLVIKASE